ncbi:zinc finger protein 578-like isoform X2 [Hyalella azteca]|uniref:Zinc finger protein 578-like isoform X2 n=1 Tax=Hyalella azteca TaxID=294128 RepID=A0A979FNH0_HYAAZ|nr:zinc finger protein 578-like isoform X2 [Hyalella azteca]
MFAFPNPCSKESCEPSSVYSEYLALPKLALYLTETFKSSKTPAEMKELPVLQESSDAVKLGAGLELCHHTAEDCRQMEHSLQSCVMAVKIEPRDKQQSNCDSGLPAGFLEVEKEEPFFMEEDSATVADFKPFQFPFLGLDSLKAEPVEAGASPSIPQVPPANQELPTRAGIFTAVQKASETACLASTSLEVHNCGASMALPPSETSTSKGKSQTNEMKISSTEQEAGEARSPNNGRLPPTTAPSVNCNVLSYNGTRTVPATLEASFKAKEAHNSVDLGRSKHLRIKLKKCSVLLTRIHVSENYKYVYDEENENNICSEEIAFPEPHPDQGSKDSEQPEMRSEKVGKSGGPNSSKENKINFSKNTDSLRRTSFNRSKRLNASMKEAISSTTSHVRRNKEKALKCHVCGVAFRFKCDLDRHINAFHLKLRPYKCSKCDYASSQVSRLQTHLNTVHAKLKPFKCDECDSYFSRKGDLKAHISRVHLKDRPHSCPHCSYSVWSKAGLARHISIVHLKLKPHKCPQCDHSCSSKRNLDYHVNSVHLKLRPHKCQTCKRGFYQKTKLEQHMKSVHMNLREHKCAVCDYAAGSRGVLKRHVDVVHLKMKKYKCDECDSYFCIKSNLTAHISKVHLKDGL